MSRSGASQSEGVHRIRLRLDRAQHHLQTLKSAIDSYMASEPYIVVIDKDSTSGEGEIRIVAQSPPPAPLSLILGDCVHNLRSVLDHIAWQLSVSYRGNAANVRAVKSVSFPICGAETSTPGLADWSSTAPRALQDVDSAVWDVFRIFQPFKPRNLGDTYKDHPLWLLNELWNFDKHRQLVLVLSFLYDNRIGMTSPEGVIDEQKIYTGPLERETVVARFCVTPPGACVRFNGEHRVDVAFYQAGPIGTRHAFNTLLDIYDFVRDEVVPAFTPLL